MQELLTDEEARVLGSLVEKSLTTPEYYPLSLNALKNACNQKSSREPVVDYDDAQVARALEGLRDKHFVWFVDSADSRVQKYRHRLAEALDLTEAEMAVVDLLLLRGPQTPGELRGRSDRLHPFPTVEEVEGGPPDPRRPRSSPRGPPAPPARAQGAPLGAHPLRDSRASRC